jgi:metal-sulfur cluster biosynthetic enzyme
MTETSINPIVKENELREALRKVIDPEIGLSVIELGLIRGIEIEPDKASLTVIMTTPFCPYGPMLIEQIRTTAQATLEVPTTIEIGDELWEPSMMEEGAGGDWGLF